MNLNISYDSLTLSTAPSAFFSAVNYVVNLFDTTFTANVTVNIEIGYGDFPTDGSIVPPLGESLTNYLTENYGQVRNALASVGAVGASSLSPLPPLSGSLQVATAEAKALGLTGASSSLDGWVGIASNSTLASSGMQWSFSPTATPNFNQYYVVGTLEHEISEVMGRTSALDTFGQYSVLDLYRYSAPGILQGNPTGNAYFSVDGGKTHLDTFNNFSIGSGDLGDWANSAGADAFLAASPPQQINGFTATDLTELMALGWTTTPVPVPDLIAGSVALSSYSLGANATLTVSYHIQNIGSATAGASVTQIYLSTAHNLTSAQTLLGSVPEGALGSGQSVSESVAVTLPSSLSPGTYWIEVVADGGHQVSESDESNNAALSSAVSVGGTGITAGQEHAIEALFVGYFGRAGAPGGVSYWIDRLDGITGPAMTEAQVAASFSVQSEATALYPFLANPLLGDTAAASQFVSNVFQDLFNRGPASTGLNYWVAQLEQRAGDPQAVGQFILDVISGAQGNDVATLNNKVNVASYFTDRLAAVGRTFDANALAEAHHIIPATTLDPTTVANEQAAVDSFLASGVVSSNIAVVGQITAADHFL